MERLDEKRLVYFYRRDNEFGFDGVSIISFSKKQSRETLKELVKNPDEWYYDHIIDIDKHLYEDED